MDATPANLQELFRQFVFKFADAYQLAEPQFDKFVTKFPSASGENVYPFMGDIPGFRKWLGEKFVHTISARSYSLKNEPFEWTMAIPKMLIKRDQYGVYASYAEMGGTAAKLWQDELVQAALLANPIGFDGVAFFSTAHPNTSGLPGANQSNLLALPLTAANYATARQAMMQFKSDGGRFLNINPTLLVVPPQLEDEARTLINADVVTNAAGTASQSNIYKGSAEMLVMPQLASQPTAWYLFDTTKPIQPMIFQLEQAPEFVFKNDPKDDTVFYKGQYVYGAEAYGAAGVSLWFLGLKSVG